MCFDAPYSRTVDETGVNTVPITTTGNEKTHFTVVLACSETGKKLKPLVIFKRKTLSKENVPNGVVVHCQSKGWVDRDGMAVWAEKDGDEDVRGNLKKEHMQDYNSCDTWWPYQSASAIGHFCQLLV